MLGELLEPIEHIVIWYCSVLSEAVEQENGVGAHDGIPVHYFNHTQQEWREIHYRGRRLPDGGEAPVYSLPRGPRIQPNHRQIGGYEIVAFIARWLDDQGNYSLIA